MSINFNVNGAGKTQKAEHASSTQSATEAKKTTDSENIYEKAPKAGELKSDSETARAHSKYANKNEAKIAQIKKEITELEKRCNDKKSEIASDREVLFLQDRISDLKNQIAHLEAQDKKNKAVWDKFSQAENIEGQDVTNLTMEERVDFGEVAKAVKAFYKMSKNPKYSKLTDIIEFMYKTLREKTKTINLLECENENLNQENFELNKKNMELIKKLC